MGIIFILLLVGVLLLLSQRICDSDIILYIGVAFLVMAVGAVYVTFILWISESGDIKNLQKEKYSILYRIENEPIDDKLLKDIKDFNSSINFSRKWKLNPFVGCLAPGAGRYVDPIIFEYELEIKLGG